MSFAAASRSGAAAHAAHGPMNALLSSPLAQWATLGGLGAYIVSPETAQAVLQRAVLNLTNGNHVTDVNSNNSSTIDSRMPSSIVIHTGSSDGSNSRNGSTGTGGNGGSVVTTLVTYTVAAGCVWVTYTVLSHALPDYVSHLLPVTRKVFDTTSKNLATSILNLRDVIGNQVVKLMKKQDALGHKQDDLHRDVTLLSDEVQLVRTDVLSILESVERCDEKVEASQHLQSYTARGVKLLVSAVGAVMAPTEHHALLRELERYSRDGDVFGRQLERSNSTGNNSNNVDALAYLTSSALTTVPEPPENEHPLRYTPNTNTTNTNTTHRHSYQEQNAQGKHEERPSYHQGNRSFVTPPPQSSSSSSNHSNNGISGDELMAMIRDGRLIVPNQVA